MISGGGNFPIRKKEKQNAARERHMGEWEAIKGLLGKIEAAGTGGISSDDPDALAKLRVRLSDLESIGMQFGIISLFRAGLTKSKPNIFRAGWQAGRLFTQLIGAS